MTPRSRFKMAIIYAIVGLSVGGFDRPSGLIGYSMILGLYFAALGFLLTAAAKAFRSPPSALLAAPFFWVALELLSAT